MDTHPTQSPTPTPGAVKAASWCSSASGISCLYITTLLAVYGLAIGLTVIFMAPPARLKVALLEHASATGYSEPVNWDANTLEAGQLKRYYLDCARDSFPQGTYGEAACSQVADTLLARRFDGNFNRMVDWWQTATCLGPDRGVFTRCR